MKKYLLILIAALVLLYSCGGGTSSVSSDTEDISEYSIAESVEYSEDSDCSREYSEDEAEFIAKAVDLLEKDAEITSLIILGGIYEGENQKDGSTVLYPLSSDNEYHNYSSLDELIGSVYMDGGGGYVLNFPPYGTKTVKSISGETWFSTHYVPDYSDYALTDTVKILSLDENNGSVSVFTFLGFEVTVTFTKTAGGWRMDECLYKLVTDMKNASSDGEGYKSAAMEIGSAVSLTGSCLIINVFINDQVSEWNDDDIAETIDRLDDACAFTESMAGLYGSPLDITSTDKANSLYLDTTEKLPTDINNFVWMDLLFSDTVYNSLRGYAEHYFDLGAYDNWCVMFHINKKGRSYAIPCDKTNSDWEYYTAERCVVFHTDDDTYTYYDSAGVYVHELLHLFGAVDLYTPYITDADDALLENYFPNDIMRVIPLDTGLSSVSPYTAFQIGWVNYLDGQFVFLLD